MYASVCEIMARPTKHITRCHWCLYVQSWYSTDCFMFSSVVWFQFECGYLLYLHLCFQSFHLGQYLFYFPWSKWTETCAFNNQKISGWSTYLDIFWTLKNQLELKKWTAKPACEKCVFTRAFIFNFFILLYFIKKFQLKIL